MVYLDYAANTPVDERVLDVFVNATRKFIANPNSSHELGLDAKCEIDRVSTLIGNYFNIEKDGVIYTSGSSESNNLVIKGICNRNKKFGKHIIISAVEHSSVVAPCNYLANLGFDVSVVPLTKEGVVDLDVLKQCITDDTILVSICAVDGEVGTTQPISEIAKIVSEYPHCVFHTDATQAVGKVNMDYTGVDFITFAPHKFFGLNGFGVLLNCHNKKMEPLIHGGKSTTVFRSGTPVTANVVALGEALKIAIDCLDERHAYIESLNKMLRDTLGKYDKVHINSPVGAMVNTLNISLIDIPGADMIRKLNDNGIYLSSTTACSLGNMPSKSVLAITGDKNLASNTIRISISHLTTKDEIEKFLKVFDNIYHKLEKSS